MVTVRGPTGTAWPQIPEGWAWSEGAILCVWKEDIPKAYGYSLYLIKSDDLDMLLTAKRDGVLIQTTAEEDTPCSSPLQTGGFLSAMAVPLYMLTTGVELPMLTTSTLLSLPAKAPPTTLCTGGWCFACQSVMLAANSAVLFSLNCFQCIQWAMKSIAAGQRSEREEGEHRPAYTI